MFLHIAEDEKFIDSIIEALEEISPGQNIFLIRIPFPEYKLKYIKSSSIICATYNSPAYNNIIEEYKHCSAVIFHNFINRYKWDLIKKLPQNTTKVWIAWGADLYSSAKLNDTFYKPLTKKHIKRLKKANSTLKGPLKSVLFDLGSFIPLRWRVKLGINDNIQNYFKFIDYICPVIYEDYELLKKHYPNVRFKYLPFNYNVNSKIYRKLDMPINRGNNILVGNSASPFNNHLDTFEILKSIQLEEGQKIIVPLSYGGDEKYKEAVIQRGKEYFGSNFWPILNFMQKEEYDLLLQSVGFGFFNSLRQHAMGNINLLIFLGAKVFLDANNPAFSFYKRISVNVYSIVNDKIDDDLSEYQSLTVIKKNRQGIYNCFGSINHMASIEAFINELG